jgi:hypothetical protein
MEDAGIFQFLFICFILQCKKRKSSLYNSISFFNFDCLSERRKNGEKITESLLTFGLFFYFANYKIRKAPLHTFNFIFFIIKTEIESLQNCKIKQINKTEIENLQRCFSYLKLAN